MRTSSAYYAPGGLAPSDGAWTLMRNIILAKLDIDPDNCTLAVLIFKGLIKALGLLKYPSIRTLIRHNLQTWNAMKAKRLRECRLRYHARSSSEGNAIHQTGPPHELPTSLALREVDPPTTRRRHTANLPRLAARKEEIEPLLLDDEGALGRSTETTALATTFARALLHAATADIACVANTAATTCIANTAASITVAT